MLDLFLKLVDRFIELRKVKRDIDRSFFTDHLEPAFAAFEAVHQDYLTTIAKYVELIESSRQKFDRNHPVLREIEADSQATVHLRARLIEATGAQPNPIIRPFVLATCRYFLRVCESDFLDSAKYRNDPTTRKLKSFNRVDVCVPRCSIHYYISDIAQSDASRAVKKDSAVHVVTGVTEELQVGYQDVCREFNRLKTKLLAPR